MAGFLLALFLVILMNLGMAVLVRLFVNVDSPLYEARRRLALRVAVRREVADLDARYEELVRSLSQPGEPHS